MTGLPRRDHPWVFLGVITVTHLCAVLDRVAISLLVEPIKADVRLTDTEVSLLQGLAMMLGLVGAIVPLGILVDRVNRTRLLAVGVGVWSLMTGLCGLAHHFWTLFLTRMGVGVGEATLQPAGSSLISDIFDKRRLGVALSVFTMGGAIGTGLSFVAGGLVIGAVGRHGNTLVPVLGVLHPWQLTLVLIALPGLFMALVVSLLPNPPRRTPGVVVTTQHSESLLRAFYRENKRLLACHHVALGGSALVLLGAYSWVAPLFSRVYGWTPATIGVSTGIVVTIAAPVGLIGGGVIGDYLTRYGAHLRLVVCAISVASGAICGLIYPLLPNPQLTLVFYGGMAMFVSLPHGIGIAALQHILPNEIRGRVSAVFYLTVTVVAVFGPTLIASISDVYFPFKTGIRYATAIVIPSTLLISTVLYLVAIPPYRRLELSKG